MYAATGDHFTIGSRITWSIEPDGTNLGGASSNLVSTLNARFGSGNWVRPLQDAFAVWENVANINFVQVSDNGAPINSGGYQQGDPGFGDIRIGAFGFDPSALGFALLPPPNNGGSDAGDIILNSNQPWQIGNDYDLETVMIHEIGHALGLGHSADQSASMYAYYHGVQSYVASDDVAGVQSIWTARQEDGFVQGNQNLNAAHAVDVTQNTGPNKQVILGPLNVARSSEAYWFKVTTPAVASNVFQAQVQSTNLSELSPKVTIYDANVRGLVQVAASSSSYGATVTAQIYNASPNTTYYVKVAGSNAGPTGTGAYALQINMGTQNLTPFVPATTQVLAQPDQGGQGLFNSTTDTSAPGPQIDPNAGNGHGRDDHGDDGHGSRGKGSEGDGSDGRDRQGRGTSNNVSPLISIVRNDNGPDTLMIGGNVFQGDLLTKAPTPSTPAPAASTAASAGVALIPIDPSTPSGKKDSAVIVINAPHPTGPL